MYLFYVLYNVFSLMVTFYRSKHGALSNIYVVVLTVYLQNNNSNNNNIIMCIIMQH